MRQHAQSKCTYRSGALVRNYSEIQLLYSRIENKHLPKGLLHFSAGRASASLPRMTARSSHARVEILGGGVQKMLLA